MRRVLVRASIPALNTTFSFYANTAFNNAALSRRSLVVMESNTTETIHPTFRRLLAVAMRNKPDEFRGTNEGYADLARLLGISEQLVTNWKSRGVPPKEFTHLARLVGCHTDEIEFDEAEMTPVMLQRAAMERLRLALVAKGKTSEEIITAIEGMTELAR